MKPKRIVSLCPSNTEILFALGLVESIVGVDSHSDYPTQVKELPRVGTDLRINMEKVKALEPDLVVAPLTVPGMERNIEALEKTKLSYIILNPHNIEEIIENILMLGEITNTLEEAQRLVDEKKKRVYFVPESLFGRPVARTIEQLNLKKRPNARCTEPHELPEIFCRFEI